MRKPDRIGVCAAALLSATVAIAAQQPPPAQPPAPSNPPSTAPPTAAQPPASTPSDNANKVTITGCLQPAPPAPTGTAGTTDAKSDSAANEKFMLTNVTSAAAKEAGAAGTSAARTYRLVANEAALSPHSGKKLELTGVLEEQAGAPRAASPTTPASPASNATAPKLVVESGKVIAPTCAE